MDFNTLLIRLGIDPSNFVNKANEPIKTDTGFIYEVEQDVKERKCPYCNGERVNINDHDTVEIDCSQTDYITDTLRIRKVRLICKDCKKTFTPTIPGISRYYKTSDQTIDMIKNDFYKMLSFSDIAKRYNLTVSRIIQLFDKLFNRVPRKTLPFVLCIDEKKFKEEINQNYCCILYDFDSGSIVDVVKNRQLAYLEEYFSNISERERNGVKYYISDMFDSYKTIRRRYFPKALHVVDLFHVVKLLTQAINSIRIKAMKTYDTDTIEYSFMKRHWKLFLCRKEDIPVNKTFLHKKTGLEYPLYDMVFRCVIKDETLNKGYNILQDLYHYNHKDSFTDAFEFVLYIADRLILSGNDSLETVGHSYKRWAAEIANGLAYSQSNRRFTNTIAEANNNHIQTIVKIAYGYHNFERFRKRVLLIRTYKKDLK